MMKKPFIILISLFLATFQVIAQPNTESAATESAETTAETSTEAKPQETNSGNADTGNRPAANEETATPAKAETTTPPVSNEETTTPARSDITTPPVTGEENKTPARSDMKDSTVTGEETSTPAKTELKAPPGKKEQANDNTIPGKKAVTPTKAAGKKNKPLDSWSFMPYIGMGFLVAPSIDDSANTTVNKGGFNVGAEIIFRLDGFKVPYGTLWLGADAGYMTFYSEKASPNGAIAGNTTDVNLSAMPILGSVSYQVLNIPLFITASAGVYLAKFKTSTETISSNDMGFAASTQYRPLPVLAFFLKYYHMLRDNGAASSINVGAGIVF